MDFPSPIPFSPLPLLLHYHVSWGLCPAQISSLNFKSRSQIPQTQHGQHWPSSPLRDLLPNSPRGGSWPHPCVHCSLIPDSPCPGLTHSIHSAFQTPLKLAFNLQLRCCHSGLKTSAAVCSWRTLFPLTLTKGFFNKAGRGTSDEHICVIASVGRRLCHTS